MPVTSRFHRVVLRSFGLALFALLCAFSLHKLFIVSWNQLYTVDCYDCDLFWAVGRGMLNGLTPYKDLFETKPPGIFLLSGLSLWLTDGRMLGGIASYLATVTLGIAPGMFTFFMFRDASLQRRALLAAIGVMFGTSMVFYIGRTSWNYMPEQFGAVFGALYVLLLAQTYHVRNATLSRIESLVAGVFMFGAIFMKEPFVLTLVAAALLLSVTIQDVIRKAVVPLAIAGALYGLVLTSFGLLVPYVTIYLRQMLGWRVGSGGSLWARPFRSQSYADIFENVYHFSPLAIVLLALLLLAIAVHIIAHSKQQQRREMLLRFSFVMLSFYLTVLAVFTGGSITYGQHYLFAVPVYVALFSVVMWHMHRLWHTWHAKLFFVSLAMVLAAFSLHLPREHFQGWLGSIAVEDSRESQLAADVDELLSACEEDRYLYIGLNGKKFFGHTKHSPYGPLFVQYEQYFNESYTAMREEFWRSLNRAGILVYDRHNAMGAFGDSIDFYVEQNFTVEPWNCSTFDPAPYPEITLYYRKKSHGTQ